MADTPNTSNTADTSANTVDHQKLGEAIDQNSKYLANLNEQTDTARTMLDLLSNTVGKGTDAFGKLSSNVSAYMDQLNSSADLTTSAMGKMSLAITAAVGAAEPFKTRNFDGLTTFSGQVGDLVNAAGGAIDVLEGLASHMGIKIPASIDKTGEAIGKYIKNTALAADYSLKTEDVYIKLAAQTGELGSGYLNLANNTEHINEAVGDQISQFTAASRAANTSIDDAQKYYLMLKEIPDKLNTMTESGQHASGSVEYLTKAMLMARGTGRDYADVFKDMHAAVRNYNASIPEAMKFTEQISEISKNYHVELEDVRQSLIGTASAFKMFGNEGTGAADILNKYVGSLKATGLSGAVATDIVTNMTAQIGQLSIAQKGFLSSQSGGPGGLMGSYSIDMKLRQGKLDEVFEMTKNQLTKMMGPLVSTQEAANSPQAAAQMTKQIMMLKQGPLGSFAKTDAEAERIIDAFKSGKSADFKELATGNKGVDAAAKTGYQLAHQSNTYLKSIRDLLAEARGQAATGMIDLYQSGGTAGAGSEVNDYNQEDVKDFRAAQRDRMAQGAKESTTPANGVRDIDDYTETMTGAWNAAKAATAGIAQSLKPAGAPEAGSISDPIEQRHRMAVGAQQSQQDAHALSYINSIQDLPGFNGVGLSDTASTVAKRQGRPTGIDRVREAMSHKPAEEHKNLGEITVKVEGYCLDCGEKIRSRSQTYAVAPQTK